MAYRFRPGNGDIFADAIPYYHNGEYHIFYLRGKGDDLRWPRWKTCWAHMKSTDLMHWEQLPNALEIGEQRKPDGGACYTGCVFKKDGLFHIFYVGFNPGHPEGREQILHAVSSDLVNFTKDPDYTPVIIPDGKIYRQMTDWRDPYIFVDEEDGLYWMLLTANTADESVPYSRSGVTALAKSDDLVNWTLMEPIYSPLEYPALEVNEVFRMGEWWYLMFTDFKGHTEYRMSRSVKGPWIRPRFPELDLSTHFYAGRSLTDGNRRLIFGWCGTLLNGIDDPYVQWGGDMLTPREIRQGEDGELCIVYPEDMKQRLTMSPAILQPRYGEWNRDGNSYGCSSPHSFSAAMVPDSEDNFSLSLRLVPWGGHGKLGVAINCAEDFSHCYYIDLDTGKCQFEMEHYCFSDRTQSIENKVPGLTKPILISGTGGKAFTDILIIKKAGIAEVFIDDCVVATIRCSELPSGNTALFCENMDAGFLDVRFGHLDNFD